jgi:hypothetical protein
MTYYNGPGVIRGRSGPQFGVVDTSVIRCPVYSPVVKIVYTCLATHADSDRQIAGIPQETISHESGLSVTDVSDALREATKGALIELIEGGGYQLNDFLVQRPAEPAPPLEIYGSQRKLGHTDTESSVMSEQAPTTSVPTAAVQAALEAALDAEDHNWPGVNLEVAQAAVGAAPHIARAAVVAAFRDLAGVFGRNADSTRHDEGDVYESSVWERAHTEVRNRILEFMEQQ